MKYSIRVSGIGACTLLNLVAAPDQSEQKTARDNGNRESQQHQQDSERLLPALSIYPFVKADRVKVMPTASGRG
jgi:ABC-type nitrate/sulfonate/bicarbonate transport system ATPase subunit